jgi:hypothetical protein
MSGSAENTQEDYTISAYPATNDLRRVFDVHLTDFCINNAIMRCSAEDTYAPTEGKC